MSRHFSSRERLSLSRVKHVNFDLVNLIACALKYANAIGALYACARTLFDGSEKKMRSVGRSRNGVPGGGGPVAEDKEFHQTDYNIIGNQKEMRGHGQGRNPISDLIAGDPKRRSSTSRTHTRRAGGEERKGRNTEKNE